MQGDSFLVSVVSELQFVEVTRPKREIISEELHDGRRVAVLFFLEAVQILDCVIKSLLCELASDVWRGENFVVKHRVVQCEAQANGVRRLKVLSLLTCLLVAVLCFLNHFFAPTCHG